MSDTRASAKADKRFLASYEHDGHAWGLHFYATDFDDAREKVRSIRRSLELDGQAALHVSMPTFGWIRQWFRRK